MTPEERDARITAYALGDPGLTAADRQEVETAIQADAAARKAVEETRALAQLLTTGLAAEPAAVPAGPPVTIPSAAADRPKPKSGRWRWYAATAAAVLAVFGGLYAIQNLGVRSQMTSRDLSWNTAARPEAATASPDMQFASDRLADEAARSASKGKTDAAAGTMMSGAGGLPGGGDAGRGESTKAIRDGVTAKESLPADPAERAAGLSVVTPAKPAAPSTSTPSAPARPGQPAPLAEPKPDAARANDYREIPPGVVAESLPGLDDAVKKSEPSANDRYPALAENRFVAVEGQAALSTFGVDVDTASYAIVRKYLTMGQLPPANAVRLEELVNYFPYRDKAPDGDNPFAVTVELAECPWQPKHRLARIGLKAKPIETDKRPPSNLVFLIDVSGSMAPENRLPLVKTSLKMLVNQLGENDRVAMVVYAGAAGLVLDSTSAVHKGRILDALDQLQSGGSTNGAGGIQQAYDVAAANFIKGGTNRVILCTDGDWNVGTTSTNALVRLIEQKRETGVFLSVFGFGMGNLRDEMMVRLAGKGNGNYGYIDTPREAYKALVEQLGGTLVTVAKDVKIQVEFNPAVVGAYRLLGYEKRALAAKDFADDKKDAGEMGAGHVVTALYELVPAGGAVPGGKEDGLRYQANPEPKPAAKTVKSGESFVVKMRHKKPDGDTSTLRELPVTDPGKGYGDASEDFRFSAAVASFAMLLRESPNKGNATFAAVQELAGAAAGHDPGGYRAEFLELVRRAKTISGKP